MVVTPCNKKMTMTEFTQHIHRCQTCIVWWTKQSILNKQNRTKQESKS